MDKLAVIIALLAMGGAGISAIYLVIGLISPKLVKAVDRVQVLKRVLILAVIFYGLFKLGAIGFAG